MVLPGITPTLQVAADKAAIQRVKVPVLRDIPLDYWFRHSKNANFSARAIF